MTNVPVPKRADQLVVGDRIQPGYLPAYARSGEGVVRYVETYHYRDADWVFAAFACADGDRNCAYYLPGGELKVIPAIPLGHDYSRADDDPEVTQPIAGRIPAHLEDGRTGEVVLVGGGADVDAAFLCPVHGEHPHYVGDEGSWMVCLDCPQCRPAGAV